MPARPVHLTGRTVAQWRADMQTAVNDAIGRGWAYHGQPQQQDLNKLHKLLWEFKAEIAALIDAID